MAKFNPDINPVISNAWVNASQGQKANTALGDLFEGLAGAVKVYRQGQKDNENKALEAAIGNEADSLFYTEPPSPQEPQVAPTVNPQTAGPNRGLPDPPQYTRAMNQINRYASAWKQGGMDDRTLYIKMGQAAKRLAIQFPDRKADIYSGLRAAAGNHPLNLLREEENRLQAAEESQMSDVEKRKFQLLKEKSQYLDDPYVSTLYKKLAGKDFNVNDFDEKAFLVAVGARQYDDAEVTRQKDTFALSAADRADKKERAILYATQGAMKIRDKILFTITNNGQPTTKVKWSDLEGIVKSSLLEASPGGTKVTPEERTAVETLANRLELETNLAVDSFINTPDKDGFSYGQYITDPKDIQNIKDQVLSPLRSLKAAVLDGDWTTVASLKRNIEAKQLEKENKMLQDTNFNVALEQAKQLMGEKAVTEAFAKMNDPALFKADKQSQAVVELVMLSAASGQSPYEIMTQRMKDGSIKGSDFYSGMKAYITELSGPNVSKERASELAKVLFGKSEQSILDGPLTKESEDALWNLYTNPGLIEKLKGTESADDVYRWGYKQGVVRLAPLANQIVESQVYTDNTTITYDPTKGRFVYQGTQADLPYVTGGTPRLGESLKAHRGRDAVNTMNQYLDTMQPIIEGSGGSMDMFLNEVFNGVDYKHMNKEGSIWTRIRDAFRGSGVGPPAGGGSLKDTSPSTRQPLPVLPEPQSSLPEDRRQSRGDRNNNPGNIEYGAFTRRRGATGTDGRFATFATPEQGINALSDLLGVYQRRHGLTTVRQMINRWAPPGENDTGSYARRVAREMGVNPDDPVDLEANPEQRAAMVQAIIRHENGYDPYGAEYIQASLAE